MQDHQKDIQFFQKNQFFQKKQSTLRDPQLKSFAQQTLPVLQQPSADGPAGGDGSSGTSRGPGSSTASPMMH